jgi:hypothetical protein
VIKNIYLKFHYIAVFALDLKMVYEGKYSNVAGLGLHDKGRTYTGGTGLDKKPKT